MNNFKSCYALGHKSIAILLLLPLFANSSVFAGQAYVGKTIIDGVEYGNNDNQVLKGSGVKGQALRELEAFEKIKSLSSIEVRYHRSSKQKVELSGDQNLLGIITTKVNQGELTIDSSKSYQPQLPLVVEIYGPHLSGVTLNGSGEFLGKDINETALDINILGSGKASAEGKVTQFRAVIDGSGDLEAKDLTSQKAELIISGSGNIDITVKQAINGAISGSGGIQYFGHPEKVTQEITGSGIIQAGD